MTSHSPSKVSQSISFFDNYGQAVINLPPPAPSKGHQRSRTTIDLPPLFSRTPSTSPTRSSTFMPFGNRSRQPSPTRLISPQSTDVVDETQKKPKPGPVGRITSWFDGASEPVNITLVPSPKKENLDGDDTADYFGDSTIQKDSNMENLTQRPRKLNTPDLSTTNVSRFSFFKRASTIPTKLTPDDLAQMDIGAALSPGVNRDATASIAFRDFQASAEALLKKFQTSYVENLGALRQLTSENEVLADELEAARTRSEHLKFQLLEMAEKASDQEKITADLKFQLANPQPSVRMIVDDGQFSPRHCRRRGRTSDVSSSDESFVDSEMSSAVSVFSDIESVRTPSTSVTASPTMKHASFHSPTVMYGPIVQAQVTPVLVTQCQNCQNTSSSEAWHIVEMMKMESSCLKQRIAELEAAHDSALDFLTTLRI